MGTTVAALHRLPSGPLDDLDPWYHEGVGADRWVELIDELAAAGAPFADHLIGQRDELVAMEELVTGAVRLQTCHRDLWADNVRLGADGRVWVIDWHDCGPADPGHELAALLFEYAYTDAARARTMYDAYVTAGGPGRVEGPHDFSMAIAQLGHILEISCRRWLTSPDDRPLNETRVAEFVTKPMSRQIIAGIIDGIIDGHRSVTPMADSDASAMVRSIGVSDERSPRPMYGVELIRPIVACTAAATLLRGTSGSESSRTSTQTSMY